MIEVKNISKNFTHKNTVISALQDVSFQLESGQSLAITGTSGAGKSTLLNIMAGLDQPTAGQVFIDTQNIFEMKDKQEARFRNTQVGFVFQFHYLLNDFTVLENTMMPLLIQKMRHDAAREKAGKVLSRVGLESFFDRLPIELSGGEQQRAAIARAIIHRPRYIFADEPTGNLDEENADRVFELLCELNHDLQATLIVVTHNGNYAKTLNHHLVLEAGKIKEKN